MFVSPYSRLPTCMMAWVKVRLLHPSSSAKNLMKATVVVDTKEKGNRQEEETLGL